MIQRFLAVVTAFLCLGLSVAQAEEKAISLYTAPELAETGLPGYLLPRFSLKTGIRINDAATPDAADAALVPAGEAGESALSRLEDGALFAIVLGSAGADTAAGAWAERFRDWLLSETGQRTIAAFESDGAQRFEGAAGVRRAAASTGFEGDAALGAKLSMAHCGRCHVVSEENRMNGLGSAPSFAALKALRDWEYRFQVFHVLNPHPAFTQIDQVTEPFDAMRPSPIAPMELTQDDVDAILAFVTTVTAADLGRPVEAR